MKNLKQYDNDLYQLIEKEKERQENNIELIASENFVSPAILEAAGSILTNKYAEGYPNRRYYGGCEYIDKIESLAIDRAKELYGSGHANVQSHSGSSANLAVYMALLEPGDKVLSMSLSEGGHLTHGAPVSFSGKLYNFIHYSLDPETELIDYDKLRELAIKEKPKMILAGASAYPRKIDFSKFKEICDEVGAIFMVDMAHIAGLVAAGLHQSPVPYADVITSTSHKTLRGPRGAFILCKEKYAKAIDKSIFPGCQGGPLEHIIAAKAVAFKEAMSDDFKKYQEQVIKNAKAMEKTFINNGIRLVSGGTDNHLLLLDLTNTSYTGKEAESILDEVHITVNKNTIPNEKKGPLVTSGIRIGSPAMTSRGLKEEDMALVAQLIADLLLDRDSKENIRKKVKELTSRFPLYKE